MALCGQFVAVNRSDHVHMVHATAREFFPSPNVASDFAIADGGPYMYCKIMPPILEAT